MNDLATIPVETLPALVDRAATALASARSYAEVLEARELAGAAYDIAKRTGRLMRAKQAHDDLVAAAYRAQGDALLIESQAKMRLADEYDRARAAGEVAGQGRPKNPVDGGVIPSAADVGLTTQQISDARELRDAERADPGVVGRAISERVAAGQEPTKAAVREAVAHPAASRFGRRPTSSRRPGSKLPERDQAQEDRSQQSEDQS